MEMFKSKLKTYSKHNGFYFTIMVINLSFIIYVCLPFLLAKNCIALQKVTNEPSACVYTHNFNYNTKLAFQKKVTIKPKTRSNKKGFFLRIFPFKPFRPNKRAKTT